MNATDVKLCSTFNKSGCSNFFNNFTNSFYHLWILLTTANFPDIMLPAYAYNKMNSLFFILFLGIGLYFLQNLVFAVACLHYHAQAESKMLSMRRKQVEGLTKAWQCAVNGEAEMGLSTWVKLVTQFRPDMPAVIAKVLFYMSFFELQGTEHPAPALLQVPSHARDPILTDGGLSDESGTGRTEDRI